MRTQRGSTFVVTVAVLAGLVAIVAVAASAHQVAIQAQMNRMQMRRAQIAAEAGIQRAIASFDTSKPGVATQIDDWYTLGSAGADEFLTGQDSFRVQIVDACSKIDINTATQEVLMRLPLAQDQVDSFLDWRSAGQNARPDGAKDDYYHNLANPYNTKLRRIDSLDELLQVKGFTPNTLYEPQTTTNSNTIATMTVTNQSGTPTLYDLCETDAIVKSVSPTGQPLQNINTATLQQLRQRGIPNNTANIIIARRRGRTFTGLGQVLAIPQITGQLAPVILDNFTTDSATTHNGRINVNTASIPVLESLPGVTPDIAQQIVNKQAQGMQDFRDLMSVPGFNKQKIGAIADMVTLNSSTYIIRVVGKAGDTTCTMEALLRTDGTTKKIVRISYPPFTDMTARWGWSDVNNQIDLGATQ